MIPPPPTSTLFPYTTLFRSLPGREHRLGQGAGAFALQPAGRSEEHTSELQSLRHLVCRLLLEKKKTHIPRARPATAHEGPGGPARARETQRDTRSCTGRAYC